MGELSFGSGGFLGVSRFPRCDVDLPPSFVIGDMFDFSVLREQSQNSFGSEGYIDSPIGKDRMEQRVFMFTSSGLSAERVCVEFFSFARGSAGNFIGVDTFGSGAFFSLLGSVEDINS